MKIVRALGLVAAMAAVVACNPVHTDPVPLGQELDQTSVRYLGPSPAWVEGSASNAPGHVVYALALVDEEGLSGPADRSCAGPGGAVLPCTVTVSDVRMPGQRVLPTDGPAWVRMMTIWSGERIEVVLVCVDRATQELGCPTALRTSFRTVDLGGDLVGDLTV